MPKPNTVVVNVKLIPGRARGSPQQMFSTPGVVEFEQTFPGESDEELSTLYVLRVARPQLQSVIRSLRGTPGVEYVEEAPARKLIR